MKRSFRRITGGLLALILLLSSMGLIAPVILVSAAPGGAPERPAGFDVTIMDGKIFTSFTNASDSDVEGYFVAAVYDAGKLAYTKSQPFRALKGSWDYKWFAVSYDPALVYKAFCWDKNYIPLGEALPVDPEGFSFDSTDIGTKDNAHPNVEGVNIGRGTVRVAFGTGVEELLSQIVSVYGVQLDYEVNRGAAAVTGVLEYGDELLVTSAGGQAARGYKIITMDDRANAEVEAKVLESYDFGMQGSNIGKIEDGKITLIDGKVRRLFINDAFDGTANLVKTTAVNINRDTYTGTIGRLNSLRSCNSIITQLQSTNRTDQTYRITTSGGAAKTTANPVTGDILIVTSEDGTKTKEYEITVAQAAMSGKLLFPNDSITYGVTQDLVLEYYAGQRTPEAEVNFYIPAGIGATMDNTTVNLVGRGEVKLSRFHESRGELKDGVFENPDAHKLLGRFAVDYPYQTLGTTGIIDNADGSQVIWFKGVDLRPNNGVDFILTIKDVCIERTGELNFAADTRTQNAKITPTTPALRSFAGGSEQAVLRVIDTIADFGRLLDDSLDYSDITEAERYGRVNFAWTAAADADSVEIWQTSGTVTAGGVVTPGTAWTKSNVTIDPAASAATVSDLTANRFYQFKLVVSGGKNHGEADKIVGFYSGKLAASLFGMTSTTNSDAVARTNQAAIDAAIGWLGSIGGGTLWLNGTGNFYTATIHLKSNVYLYIQSGCNLYARGGILDAPEDAWWHYGDYSYGTSDNNDPYNNPDNFLSKQDVGHCYFQNTMIYGRRLTNIKIIGNGRIHGNSALSSSDNVMNGSSAGSRADDMIALKLCKNIEFAGISNGRDLVWNGSACHYVGLPATAAGRDNMLQLNSGGHFVLLATGCDNINTHDLYYNAGGNYRDMLDYMGCNNVYVTNIFTVFIGDDIVKPGSDCSLGFTRPVSGIYVRNIIGSTGCNNFQIGSETADDIHDVYVDNLTTLQSNKCAFSISTNDGGYMKNINLNTGHTGPVLGNSSFERSRTPIFISISHRGRVIGAKRNTVSVSGTTRGIIQNVPIGIVDGLTLNDVVITNAESGGEYTSVFVGYQMPPGTPSMCDGRFTGYIKNIVLNNVTATLKGGHSNSEVTRVPPELNIGSYNSVDMGARPSYGYYIRHVENFTIKNSSVDFEANDNRYPICLDDVQGATFENFTMSKGTGVDSLFQMRNNSTGINIINNKYIVKGAGGGTYDVKDVTGLSGTNNEVYPFIYRIALAKAAGAAKVNTVDETNRKIEVSVKTTADEMLSEITVSTGIQVEFTVTDALGTPKAGADKLADGDILKCVAVEDRDVTRDYAISVVKPPIMLSKTSNSAMISSVDNSGAVIYAVPGAMLYQLLGGVESANDLVLEISFAGASGGEKEETDNLATGDKLTATVNSPDPDIGTYSKVYTITVSGGGAGGEVVANKNYYTLRSTEVTYSASNMNATSSDAGVSYLQTPSVSSGAWVGMPFTVPANGTYKIQLIWKYNATGRATIQNSVGGVNIGPAITQMNVAQGTDVSIAYGATAVNKLYLTDLTDTLQLTAGSHELRTTATSTGTIVLYGMIVTLVSSSGGSGDVVTRDYYALRNSEVTFSAANMNATSTDGIVYVQTPSVSAGAWINMPFTVSANGTYKIQYIWKYNGSGRATIQNSIDGANVGPALTQMSQAAGTDVGVSLGAAASKFYMTDLSGSYYLTAGPHNFRTTATSTGSIVPIRLIVTLVQEDVPVSLVKEIESVQSSAPVSVPPGTAVAALGLPATVRVNLEDGVITLPVVWDTGSYNGSVNGTYNLTGSVTLPSNGNIANTAGHTASISVIVE